MDDDQLTRLAAAIAPIKWPCAYCDRLNDTPTCLWNTLKYRLICEECSCMQAYPDYIVRFDPTPSANIRPSMRKYHEPVG